jgi:hypothetical protein
MTTLADEEGLSLKSLVLGPSPFDSESLRSIPCFKDLLSLKLNGTVSRWDSQLLESIGTLPKLLELVIDADDAEYHSDHSLPPPFDIIYDDKVDERSPVPGRFNSPPPFDNVYDKKVDERSPVPGRFNFPPTQAYPDFPHHPPSNSFTDFGSESQPSPIPVSPPPAHQKDVEFNFDGFVEVSRGDSKPEMPYTKRTPSPVLHAFQQTLECNVFDLAVASRSATPLQSTTAVLPDSSPCFSALPKLSSLEIAGFKTLRTLSVTGSSSLIQEILSRIASLDLDAVTLVIHLSQAKLSAPKPSRPHTPEPTSNKLWGTPSPWDDSEEEKEHTPKDCFKPSILRTPELKSDERWGIPLGGSIHRKKGKKHAPKDCLEPSKPRTPEPTSDEPWGIPLGGSNNGRKETKHAPKDCFEPSTPRIPEPKSDEPRGIPWGGSNKGKKEKKHAPKGCFELPRPVPDKKPIWEDTLVRSNPLTVKDTAPITDDRFLALTSRIASQWANCIRVIDMKPFRSTSFFFSGPTNAILSLSPCVVLEVLDFRGWTFGPSLNNTISDLAHSWPKLTSLYFSADYITIPTLRILALSCPLLNILETNISLDDIPPIDSTMGYTLSHPLKVLSAGDNGITNQNFRVLLLIARHLNILFPHVKVTTHESLNTEQWLQIGEFVEVFQAVRKDDADRGA